MDTEQLKLVSVRAQHLGRAVREIDKALEAALSGCDFRAYDKIREYQKLLKIELRIANNEVRKADLF